MTAPAAEQAVRRFDARAALRSFIEFLAVTGLIVAQPLFDVVARNASLVVLWSVSRFELLVFVAIVVVVPPTAVTLVEGLIVAIVPSRRRTIHRVLIAIGLGLFIATIAKRATDFAGATLVVIGLVGCVPAFALQRLEPIRLWVRYLAVAPIAFALLFVFASSVTPVAFDRDPDVETAPIGDPQRVVFVMLDELPLTTLLDGSGQIDATLFPNFALLSESSTWYRNMTTVSPLTETAVPATLSGRIPDRERALPRSDTASSASTLARNAWSSSAHSARPTW